MLKLDMTTGRMWSGRGTVFADGPYVYSLRGRVGGREVTVGELGARTVTTTGDGIIVRGLFEGLGVEMVQRFRLGPGRVMETLAFLNLGDEAVRLGDIGLGFSAELGGRLDWRLCAIPFRVQLDGSRHDYSAGDLIEGRFRNAVYRDPTRPEPALVEEGRLRSEAWAWWAGGHGLLVAKYNNNDIELSVAAPVRQGSRITLRFGGAGTCLYGEPGRGHRLAPGQSFTFGTTHYVYVDGRIEEAFACYRDLLDSLGHGLPADYTPPVNWNELYDVGWHHSDPQRLNACYTRDALLGEAEKARACGCDLLYLDPGWEVAEGTTRWDEGRLGKAEDFVRQMQRDFGLHVGLRTILRCYREHWDRRHMVQPLAGDKAPVPIWPDQTL